MEAGKSSDKKDNCHKYKYLSKDFLSKFNLEGEGEEASPIQIHAVEHILQEAFLIKEGANEKKNSQKDTKSVVKNSITVSA
ncbi:hypothetical protein ACYULU_14790 [Breznakiellaceae bacterium SP9]